jgi:anti-anti-sigma factor
MKVSEKRYTKGTVMFLAGHLDSNSSPGALTELDKITESPAPLFVFDCTELRYISSAGLRVVLQIAKKVKARHKARMAMCGLSPMVHEVFEISGFLTLFAIHKTLADVGLGEELP